MRNFALFIFLCICCQFSFSQVNLSNGLVAYYPFNGTANEISSHSSSNTVITCNNWLETPSYSSSVKVGDIDVNGDKLTVEALVNVNSAWGNTGFGKLVSKHTGPSDVNYSLMPYTAEITTTNGIKIHRLLVCQIKIKFTMWQWYMMAQY